MLKPPGRNPCHLPGLTSCIRPVLRWHAKLRLLAQCRTVLALMCSSMPEASTSNASGPDAVARSFDDALALLGSTGWASKVAQVFVIGGAQVYTDALQHPSCAAVHLTEILADIDCDTFFPALPPGRFQLWGRTAPQRCKDHRIAFACYTRCAPAHRQRARQRGDATRHTLSDPAAARAGQATARRRCRRRCCRGTRSSSIWSSFGRP